MKSKLYMLTTITQNEKDEFNTMSDTNLWSRRQFLGYFGIELLDRPGMCEWAYRETETSPQIIIGNQFDEIETIINNVKKILVKDTQKSLNDYGMEL